MSSKSRKCIGGSIAHFVQFVPQDEPAKRVTAQLTSRVAVEAFSMLLIEN
jgi:hypothetical protein